MDPVTAMLIGTATGFGSNLLGFANQEHLNQQQMKFNRDERLAAQEYNTSERLAVQDYNTPENQMSRLMAAGINPNTATGMVDGSTSSPMSISASDMSPVMSQFATNMNDIAMLPQIEAQTKLVNEQAKRQGIENKYLDSIFQLNQNQIKETINNIKADTSYKQALRDLTDSQRNQIDEMLPLLIRKSEQEISQIEHAISLYEEQIKNAQKERDVMDSQIEVNQSQVGLNQSQQAVNYAQVGVLNEQQKAEVWRNECRAVGIDPDGKVSNGLLNILAHSKTGPNIARNVISIVKDNVSAAQDIYKEDIKPFLSKAKEFLSPLWNE